MRIAVLVALTLLAGCETIQSLQNQKVLSAVLVRSPDVNASGVNVAGIASALVFFGERQDDLQEAPSGLDGAAVTLSWSGGATGSVALQAGPSSGFYQLTSTAIVYEPGATYTFTVVFGGETFTGSVVAPAAAGIQELASATVPNVFPPTPNFAASFTSQSVTRAGSDIAFYAVNPVQGASSVGETTCTNAPFADAAAFVRLLIDPSPWRVPSYTLWRSDLAPSAQQQCFAPGTGTWVVSLTVVKSGTVSGNLFTGSGVLAGASGAGVLNLL